MIAVRESGRGVSVPTTNGPYAGQLPAAEARELRGLLARSLASVGFAHRDVATILGTSVRTLRRDLEEGPKKVDATLPPEAPPKSHSPGLRVPGRVELTARLMKQLREEYGPGKLNDRGEVLGDHPAVRSWLESLEERRRAQA